MPTHDSHNVGGEGLKTAIAYLMQQPGQLYEKITGRCISTMSENASTTQQASSAVSKALATGLAAPIQKTIEDFLSGKGE